MSKWPGKYIIGLTGNIATGKSVVRRMLEHLGAYTIDADALSHRAIAKDAPGYKPVIETFGKWILDSDGQSNRSKLGGLVFRDPEALSKLENQSDKVRLSMRFFDSEGVALLQTMRDGAEGIRRMMEEARALGIVFDERTAVAAENFNDNMTRLKAVVRGLVIHF